VARLTYGVLAAALATLVAGFFVRTSTLPLIASIACSAVVSILILYGVQRRLRQGVDDEEDADVTDFEFIEFEDDEVPDMTIDVRGSRTKVKDEPPPDVTVVAPRTKTKSKHKVLVIPGRSKYHRDGCRFAKGDDLREVSKSLAQDRGYEPCGTCKPG
jgi:hypothetical protein